MKRIYSFTSKTCTTTTSCSSSSSPIFQLLRYASSTAATTPSAAPSTPPTKANAGPSISASAASKRAAAKAESLAGQGLLATLLRPATGAAAATTRSHQIVQPSLTSDAVKASKWTPESVRTGVLGLKAGMTVDWNMWGVRKALTVVKVSEKRIFGFFFFFFFFFFQKVLLGNHFKSQRSCHQV
jgi:hypothetical protein